MRLLLTPRWVVAHVAVVVIGVTFVFLGFWQLDRLAERRQANAVNASRFAADPQPVRQMVDLAAADVDSLEYRRATATGIFVPEEEVLIRSQVREGQAGYEIVTPLLLDGTATIAVNRGWVPLEFDTVPVAVAAPPSGSVTIEGVVRLSQSRTAVSPDDAGSGDSYSRVDLGLLAERVDGALLPVYLEIVGESPPTELPVPADMPDFMDQGPHLIYAIQWFSFALVGAIGYGFLLRRAGRRGSNGPGEIGNDLDAREEGEIRTG